MGFKLRLIDREEYQRVVADLDLIATGSLDTLNATVSYCETGLGSAEFRRWNGSSAWLIDAWAERLGNTRGKASIETANAIAPIAIALRCMPMFQFSYLSGEVPSPNLVALGEDDGGLYGLMRNSDRWFDDLFIDRFGGGPEKYGIGESMVLLERSDLEKLADICRYLTIPSEGDLPGFDLSLASTAHARLTDLIRRTLERTSTTLAVSE